MKNALFLLFSFLFIGCDQETTSSIVNEELLTGELLVPETPYDAIDVVNDPENLFYPDVLTAKIEVMGNCSNYVFTIESGEFDSSWVAESWTHPDTNITYKNAFSLYNVCVIPSNAKVSDLIQFKVAKELIENDCVSCAEYAPTPENKIDIRLLN